jgi:type IV fimbrial biogenesis protein FimT
MLIPGTARPARPGRTTRGLTLLELAITLAVLALAAALAAPDFSRQIANQRVRAAADAIVNGLNQARAEAVRRNTPVRFTLDTTGSGWTVSVPATSAVLQTRPGSASPGITTTSSTTSREVTFLPTGQVDTAGTRLSRVTVAPSSGSADSRQVDIMGGGMIRVCLPAVTAANDERRC